MPPINCAIYGLTPYTVGSSLQWNLTRIKHLLRRSSLGAHYPNLESFESQDPQVLIDTIISDAVNSPVSAEPEWAYWSIDEYTDPQAEIAEQVVSWATEWVKSLYEGGLRQKMAFFWHNHFVTRLDDYQCPSWLYQYTDLLETHALGNFKTFVYEMGITPAMLVFLNGVQNTRLEPNENYGRELLELFTLGVDNGYTQEDIQEVARALTGWNGFTSACAPINFVPALHDSGEKTIFGRTGNWGYDELIDILFEERGPQIAYYICEKLYTYLVNPEVAEDIVQELANIMVANNYELLPVITTILRSEHFYDDAHIETVIPGHLELFLTHCRELNLNLNDEIYLAIAFRSGELGQRIFNPVDVAGWSGNRNWINSNSFLLRWQSLIQISSLAFTSNPEALRTLAIELTNNSNDPEIITKTIVDYFIVRGLPTDEEYGRATSRFKAEIPQNYYDDGSWNLSWDTAPGQITLLLNYLVTLPEFQLK